MTAGVSGGAAAQRSQRDEPATLESLASCHLLLGLVNVQKQRKEQSVRKNAPLITDAALLCG